MSWNDFEHSIWKQLKSESLTDRSEFILAVSGGLDSMVLLKAFQKLKPQAQLIVVHYHHGMSDILQVNAYRDQALQAVKSYCEQHNLKFLTAKSVDKLTSESEFRENRRKFFSEVKSDFPHAILATAHHKDDLLETWLLKMIRGTGAQSLENFKFWNSEILRPLLLFTKAEILKYAQAEGLNWVEDPTNQESDYLRNWLRNQWLHDLSLKVPGSIENLTNSLQRLIAEVKVDHEVLVINFDSHSDGNTTKATFNRTEFLQLSHADQFKTLARALTRVLKSTDQTDFSQGQLREIINRIDKNQKDIKFSIAGVNWFINAQQVMLQLDNL